MSPRMPVSYLQNNLDVKYYTPPYILPDMALSQLSQQSKQALYFYVYEKVSTTEKNRHFFMLQNTGEDYNGKSRRNIVLKKN